MKLDVKNKLYYKFYWRGYGIAGIVTLSKSHIVEQFFRWLNK